MKKYISPEVEIIKAEANDVLRTSGDTLIPVDKLFGDTFGSMFDAE